MITLAMLSGARVAPLASLRLGDVDIAGGRVDQDARPVRTKFAKTFPTWFMPVSDRALAIVQDWHDELSAKLARGASSPLFPATAMARDNEDAFAPAGLSKDCFSGSGPVREVFKRAFAMADLPYFNPHSFRGMLVRHALTLNLSPEAMKARSQNLGHADVLTTFTSYGSIPAHSQGELVRSVSKISDGDLLDDPNIRALIASIRANAAKRLPGASPSR